MKQRVRTCKRIEEIGSYGAFRIEQWRDGSGAWRAGFNWYDGDDYEFVCEQESFGQAVARVHQYVYKYYIKEKKNEKLEHV